MGASMNVFVILTGVLSDAEEHRLLAAMWRVGCLISISREENGYVEYCYGQQFAHSTREDIAQILTSNNIEFFNIL